MPGGLSLPWQATESSFLHHHWIEKQQKTNKMWHYVKDAPASASCFSTDTAPRWVINWKVCWGYTKHKEWKAASKRDCWMTKGFSGILATDWPEFHRAEILKWLLVAAFFKKTLLLQQELLLVWLQDSPVSWVWEFGLKSKNFRVDRVFDTVLNGRRLWSHTSVTLSSQAIQYA